MPDSFLPYLQGSPSAIAAIVTVVIFVKYISKRDKAMNEILTNHMSKEIEAFTTLTDTIKEMRDDIKDCTKK